MSHPLKPSAAFVPSALAEIVVLSDFWSPIGEIKTMLAGFSASGAHGVLLQIVDPAEETFPYSGRVEFVEPEGGGMITAGRAENWAGDYVARVARHRDAIRAETNKLDWMFSTHTTGRSAAELLLFLHNGMMVNKGSVRTATVKAGRTGRFRLSSLLCPTRAAAGPAQPAGAVVAAAGDAAAAAAYRFSADPAVVRHRTEGETPSRTPWWLTLLRLTAAALVILAAAGPIWIPQTGVAGSNAPLVILLDDGWSAAASWDARIKAADELIANADNDRRGVALVPLSEPARDITLMTGGTARVALRQFAPKPYAVERVETLPAIERFLKATGDSEIAWLSDGVDTGRGPEFLEGLSKTIGDRTLTIYEGAPPAHALVAAENAAAKMTVKVLRANGSIAIDTGIVRGLDQKGSPIGEARYSFARMTARPKPRSICRWNCATISRGSRSRGRTFCGRRAIARQALAPPRHRHRLRIDQRYRPAIAGIDVLSHPGAGAVRRRAARRQGRGTAGDHPISRSKAADDRAGHVGTLSPEICERLGAWIEQGGVLVRFAGPRLAQADDDLVPVKLRRGGRSLGGSLTWENRQHLASFAADGPFAGLAVPKDITISRQVLAEPDAVLATKSWASLVDGTPLVTGEHRGKGLVTLFHVSADMRWSDLPMSGTFVEMLRRIVDISGYTSNPGEGVAGEATVETVAPLRTLDGFGAFGPPPSTAKPLRADFRDRATMIIRPASMGLRRPSRGQHAGGGGPHRAARHLCPEGPPGQLHQCRAAEKRGILLSHRWRCS